MIESAKEFVRLRKSQIQEEYHRSAHEEASLETWKEVIKQYPCMRSWVAHNKTVPLEILEVLSDEEECHDEAEGALCL